ncbi:ATP-binding protein [Nitrosomonas cryotolerans]|uniref:Sensory/regulatory protein RpfC n=1 Tax=Nitrosomonas cryotolerans ATCC 49181 TaxID=1131553 RepID=A0A1N6HBX2_9PROT|nr:ATP-binding protein [Nitrosomonas cryotolerans]SIO17256.1 PAS domain S-box-containing protein [Nitrosomonas cryotolerans ATCC 49181]
MGFNSLTQRFAVWFTLVSLLPILLIGNIGLHIFVTEIQKTAIQKVSAVADKKVEQIDTYLLERLLDASLLHNTSATRSAMRELAAAFIQDGAESDAYRQLDARYREHFRRFTEEADYYDLFLISPQGTIVYSQSHESDFATNLLTGPYRDTGLARVARRALDKREGSISDFEYYGPSHGAIAAFIAFPIVIQDVVEGVLALQIYSERVFEVLSNNVGLGMSGETVVARIQDEQTALVMAPLKYDPDAALKRQIPLNSPPLSTAIHNALYGGSGGALTIDYRGKEVVAAWRHLSRMNWGMVVQMDVDEAFAPIYRVRIFGLLIMGLTLLAVIFGAILFNRRVVIPIKKLNQSALDVAAGNLHQRALVEGWNEMGQLAHTFNDMTVRLNASNQERRAAEQNLRQLNQELENRVVARTYELECANEFLAIKEEEMRSVVEHMVDCVVTTDEKGVILLANPVMEKLFGYTHDEIVGKNVSLLMPEPDRSKHDSYMKRYCQAGYGQEYVGRPYIPGSHGIGRGREVEGIHKNGERIALYLAVSEYFVGEERHFTGVMRDIREHVLMMKDLKQARIEAEQANKAKSAFLAAMSHEIRTPMNGVIGMVDVLRQSSLSGYQMEMANLIRESAYALLDIIEDILDFSKIEAGKLEIENILFPLPAVVEKACGMLAHLALSKGVELTLFIDPTIPAKVLGDPLRLRQVLVNIVNNAIKFSSKQEKAGKVSVRVLLTESDSDQIVVTFQITDNGIGMDKEMREKLFSSFTQGDTSTTRRFGGTGLGLAISHRLVKLMDAEIAVQSQPEQGATFTIEFPFKLLPESSVADGQIFDLTGLSCLVYGDTEGLSDDLSIYLKNAGARVKRLSDLTTACNEIKKLDSGLWLVVIDAGYETPPIEELCAAFVNRDSSKQHTAKGKSSARESNVDPHFIIIKRGRRRQARIEGIDVVTLDGDVMYRESLLRAMAMAAGRVQESETNEALVGAAKSAPVPPSREEALEQGKLILVAEDNEINQKVIRQQLTLLGYAADIADDGRDALKRWQNGGYALLFTDLHMPEMDGFQLTKAIRADEKEHQHIPIIALTANALKDEKEHCLSFGMDDYLSKPVQLTDLQSMLEKYLSRSKSDSNLEDLNSAVTPDAAVSTTKVAKSVAATVDIHILEELVGDDPATIRELLQNFRISAEDIAKELHAAFQAEEFGTLSSVAHKLKSSARAVGATALGELCAEMEQAGKKNDGMALSELLPRFDTEMAAVEAYLESLSK